MKIKFSKIAALLLAGVVCLAPGCTDYQSDIDAIYQKIDKLADKESVSTLQNQVNGLASALDLLKAEAATHATKTELANAVSALEEADRTLGQRVTNEVSRLEGLIGGLSGRITELEKELPLVKNNLDNLSKNFNDYKTATNTTLENLGKKDEQLEKAIKDLEKSLGDKIDGLSNALRDEITNRTNADEAIRGEIKTTKEDLIKYIDNADEKLQTAINNLNTALENEKTARENADKAEALARENGDKALSNAIAAEAKARQASDSVLTAAVAAEKIARAKADSALAKAIADEAAAREDAIEAEALARSLADTALSRRIKALKEDFDDLAEDYKSFKNSVTGEINGLKGRMATQESKMKKMEEVTIPAIEEHIALIDTLANQNKKHIQSVDDSLAAYKLATNATIKLMQDAISEIETVNAQQSDSLKAAFEKFNDYVLTTTFNAYRKLVQDSLALKLDIAVYEAKMAEVDSTLASHDLRLIAEEAYTKSLKEEIVPALEATDRALRSSIDSLCPIVAKLEARVDSIANALVVINDTLAAHNERILALQGRVDVLEDKVDVLEDKVAELMARIQSLEFVPDYNDCFATINYVECGGKYFDAESQITYKVYPSDLAENLVAAVELMLNPTEDATNIPEIFFDVVKVKDGFTRAEGDPGLQIISAKVSDRTKGAVEFTVKGQNVQDFYVPRYADGGIIIIRPWANNDPTNNNPTDDVVKHQDYASCLVLENNLRGNVMTSEYNVWAPHCDHIELVGFGTVVDGDFVYVDRYCSEIAFDNDTTVVTLWKPGTELYLQDADGYMTVAETEAKYGIDLGVEYTVERKLYASSEEDHVFGPEATAHKAVFTKLADTYAKADSLTYATEKLGSTPVERKATLGYVEDVTYTATIGGASVSTIADLHITKVKAKAEGKYTFIWQYSKDAEVEELLYNTTADKVYNRANVAVPADSVVSDFAARGLEAKDFEGAADAITSFSIKNKAGEDVTATVGLNIELNSDKTGYVFDLYNFKMDEVYTVKAQYELDAFTVDVAATITTIDRPGKDLAQTFDTVEITYTKDMNYPTTVGMTYTNIYDVLKEKYNSDGLNHMDVTAAEWVSDNKGYFDLMNEAKDKPNYSAAENGDILSMSYTVKNNDPALAVEGQDGVYAPGTVNAGTFVHTYYGDKISFSWNINVVAPKYDFRHNTYYVYGKYEKDNSAIAKYTGAYTTQGLAENVAAPFYTRVEPYYAAEKWNLEHFDVQYVVLPEAFKIVDENMDELTAETIESAGLVATFQIDSAKMVGGVVGANNDERSNDETVPGFTKISMDEDFNLYYHGWDEEVPVYGALAIANSDSTKFVFPTSFDKDFEAVYASKLTNEDDVKVGRYADYVVVKFQPLHGFTAGAGRDLLVTNVGTYRMQIFTDIKLFDARIYDPEDASTLDESICANGINLFDANGEWKVGDDANGFASQVVSYAAYDLQSDYSKKISGDVDEDIVAKIALEEEDNIPYIVFDYTQQLHLAQPVTVKVTASYIWPWIKEAVSDDITFQIRKTNVTD